MIFTNLAVLFATVSCAPTAPLPYEGPVCSKQGKYFYDYSTLARARKVLSTTLVADGGVCRPCSKTSGPVCSTIQTFFKNECAMVKAKQVRSQVYESVDGQCKLVCDQTVPENPVCAEGGVKYRTYCDMVAAGQTLATNVRYN